MVYRGTDLNLVGWKEDFMLSYATPVPAQTAALAYLKKAAGYTEGPLFLVGHSKGGNLALYTRSIPRRSSGPGSRGSGPLTAPASTTAPSPPTATGKSGP